jgi:hypothetical protein
MPCAFYINFINLIKFLPLYFLYPFIVFFGLTTPSPNYSAAPADSSEYIRQTGAFINSIQNKINPNKVEFLLEDQPQELDYLTCIKSARHDSSGLTSAEKEFIGRESNKTRIAAWPAGLIEHSTIIPKDTIAAAFAAKKLDDGWRYFKGHYDDGFYMFTPPVFLRNYTLCLFNYAYYCGGVCGEGHTILYKKGGDGWKEIQTYCGFVASRFILAPSTLAFRPSVPSISPLTCTAQKPAGPAFPPGCHPG